MIILKKKKKKVLSNHFHPIMDIKYAKKLIVIIEQGSVNYRTEVYQKIKPTSALSRNIVALSLESSRTSIQLLL